METSTNGKIKLTDCIRIILFQSHGKVESEIYAFYQHNRSTLFRSKADRFNFSPHYYKLHSAILDFECLYHNHPDIDAFDIVHKKAGDEVTMLLRSQFAKWSVEFYENDGQRVNEISDPISVAYVSHNFLEYLDQDSEYSLFTKDFVRNSFAHQFDCIYLLMKRKNYHFSIDTTVKEFYRDIIRDLYPELSAHDQNLLWKFFRRHALRLIN